eukprot:gnl/Hemi2/24342_TR8182_c1_g1_i1.p1 gnl/Hemi2/24342_TR8182_c1_g1~~gnl/Hemi2/24342_TR8182_c1_g1_i1.p1  ORF type:complete len:199 (+),score=60.10 gnl/Hemi2/24342_TR8182_c1_g1_i1:90-599(+)
MQLSQASMQGTMQVTMMTDQDALATGDKKGRRRKINIEFIEDRIRRHITFSKRKAGIVKKAYELSTLTGAQVLLLIASERGQVYTFATPKLQPLLTKPEAKNLIEECLNTPEQPEAEADGESAAPAGYPGGVMAMGGYGGQQYSGQQFPGGGMPMGNFSGNFMPSQNYQ